MKIQEFKGGYFEIGRQKGGIYRQNGKSYNNISIKKDVFLKQLKIYEKLYPEIIDELEGVSEGGKFDKNKLIYSEITGGSDWLKSRKEGCSIFGFSNNNNLYIGRNYDWHKKANKSFQIFRADNESAFKFVSLSDMWITPKYYEKDSYEYYGEDYINEKGLYIGLTYAYGKNFSFGLNPNHLMKLISEKCSKVGEAVNIFKNIPQSSPKNFFIADRNGKMIVIEHNSGKNFKIIFPKNDILIKTNHYLDPELRKKDQVLIQSPANDTFLRYFEVLMLLEKHRNNFKFGDIEKIMRKENKYVFDPVDNGSCDDTIWTLAADIRNRKYEVFFGKNKSLFLNI